MLKKMKRKKFSFIKKFIFTILFGISLICLCGAWTIDSNGNLQSDNLCNPNETYTDQSNAEGYLLNNVIANTSYIAKNYSENYGIIILNKYDKTNGNFITGFNGTNTLQFSLNNNDITNYIWVLYSKNLSTNEYKANWQCMLNEGSTALPYEPYGTWYSQANYEILENDISQLNEEIGELEEQVSDLQDSLEQLQQEYENYQELIDNTMGTTSFDISQYSVSVGKVPTQTSFDYTNNQDLTNNFSTIGYLNISDIYTNYIQSGNNNSIYITTPQSNLLTFDMVFNFTTQPNTVIKTTLTLPNGDLQQFFFSATDFNFKQDWTLANLVGSSSIGANYDINDISYKNVIITYENVGNNLSDIKLGSNNGYNTGFNSGYNTALDRINELTTELNEKTTNLQRVTEELTAKTIQYEHLYTRFQQLSDRPLQLNFQSLLWNIASTPFEVFKTMWNFDFLGFNIAQFVTR